jgi:hypothetical protein
MGRQAVAGGVAVFPVNFTDGSQATYAIRVGPPSAGEPEPLRRVRPAGTGSPATDDRGQEP